MHLIDYRDLSAAQRAQVLDIHLSPEQQRYAGDVESALYLLHACSERQCCLVMLVEQRPRGLLLLQRGAFLPTWAEPDAAMLIALQVDQRAQGQGLGRACMQALPAVVRALWPDIGRLQLSVAPENVAAVGLYQATGWVHSGPGYRTAQGQELSMSLLL
ncbi:GNAT family N-acetyltransferase [Pseudomonas sp. RP23018S]|uniref:GNAT family N-acetyltransferase n=1 Tax=Pseudomonas sp. RP23018S TaxID=3096037 RepID=UPI002ACA7022|nr:GNAT family N-acetyltransferase [Pseudomonas sp. RP23018S]MDZ5604694.1 GNAT family N-acetyltransferase [Pseudomonas sp. RP23018S]